MRVHLSAAITAWALDSLTCSSRCHEAVDNRLGGIRMAEWLGVSAGKRASRVRAPGASLLAIFALTAFFVACGPEILCPTKPAVQSGLWSSAEGGGLGAGGDDSGRAPLQRGCNVSDALRGSPGAGLWVKQKFCSLPRGPARIECEPQQQPSPRKPGSSTECSSITTPDLWFTGRCNSTRAPPIALVYHRHQRVTVTRTKRLGRFFKARLQYDTKASSTYQGYRLVILSGDIEVNPGPTSIPDPNHRHQAPITTPMPEVKVLYQNCRSLRNKLGVLRAHSPELERYDIIAISETWLSQDVMDSELQTGLTNHSWFRRDRPTHGGGVACAVRSCLSPVRRQDMEPADAELLFVELNTKPKLIMGVCYCPPADDDALNRTMVALQAVVHRYPDRCLVLGGDFNVPDACWSRTDSGRAAPAVSRPTRRALNFIDACDMLHLYQYVYQPTRGANTLDLVFSNRQCVADVDVQDGVFESDHKQVAFVIERVKVAAQLTSRHVAFNYKQAEFEKLRRSLELVPWDMIDGMHVDAAVDVFYDFLNAAVRDCIPVVQIKRNFPPWFDRDLRLLLREKEAAYRRLKRNRCQETSEAFRAMRARFKMSASKRYTDYLTGLTDEFKTNPKRFWSFLKSTKNGNRGLPTLVVDNVEITDDQSKANALNSFFESKFTSEAITVLPKCPSFDLLPLVSMDCNIDLIRAVLDSIPPNKACGPDGISARIIRECSGVLSVPLAKICRLSIEQGVFPEIWKRANVVPVFKKGCVKDPRCYRSISLIPLFGKILEKVAYVNLMRHVESVIAPEQHGFFPGRSCATNLATLLSTAWKSIEEKSQTDCIYTDFSAAFQSVNHTLLIHKLKNSYNVSGMALSWFTSYLENRKQRVIVNGKCSEWCRVTSGTPEGGVISALCFALYINDLPLEMSSRVLLYADDAKLYKKVSCQSDADILQKDLEKLCQWSKTWKLVLNPSKCKSFTMTLKRNPLVTKYTIGNELLECVDKIRDLGVTLDVKLTFGGHIEQTVRKGNRALGVLIRSFQKANPRGHLNVPSVLTSYCTHVRSVLEYCSVVWNGAADAHTERISRIEHKFLMWLNAHCRDRSATLSYGDLLRHFKLTSVSARRTQHDIMFLRNVFEGRISSSFLLQSFSLNVPSRATRQQASALLHVPFARVNTVKQGLFVRLPGQLNRFVKCVPSVDLFTSGYYSFRGAVRRFVASL